MGCEGMFIVRGRVTSQTIPQSKPRSTSLYILIWLSYHGLKNQKKAWSFQEFRDFCHLSWSRFHTFSLLIRTCRILRCGTNWRPKNWKWHVLFFFVNGFDWRGVSHPKTRKGTKVSHEFNRWEAILVNDVKANLLAETRISVELSWKRTLHGQALQKVLQNLNHAVQNIGAEAF